jgi:hypothetical protein
VRKARFVLAMILLLTGSACVSTQPVAEVLAPTPAVAGAEGDIGPTATPAPAATNTPGPDTSIPTPPPLVTNTPVPVETQPVTDTPPPAGLATPTPTMGDKQVVVVDSQAGQSYDVIAGAPVFRLDSQRVAYVAQCENPTKR